MHQVGGGELTDRLNAAIDRAIADKRIVGAVVLIARDGKPSFRRAAGLADRETTSPMREKQIFRFSSLTKPIVTAAAMALLERGRIRFEDPLTQWIPEFRPEILSPRLPTLRSVQS